MLTCLGNASRAATWSLPLRRKDSDPYGKVVGQADLSGYSQGKDIINAIETLSGTERKRCIGFNRRSAVSSSSPIGVRGTARGGKRLLSMREKLGGFILPSFSDESGRPRVASA